jgi:alpha-tubulin suppressor-like RCC1 family protein
VTSVATGNALTAAVTKDGRLLTWGRGESGQLGLGATDLSTPSAVDLPTGVRVVKADAGERHLVALTSKGALLTWGVGPRGQLLDLHVHTKPSWGEIRDISVGDNHTVALTRHGIVLAWGANSYGQLGIGDLDDRAIPTPIRFPRLRGRVTAISSGGGHVLALTSHDQVFAWGHNAYGQNGDGGTKDQTTPEIVSTLNRVDIRRIHAGRYHNVVVAYA